MLIVYLQDIEDPPILPKIKINYKDSILELPESFSFKYERSILK